MTDYSRNPSRSYFGSISDRMADGMESVLVIGDVTSDIDCICRQVKERDGYPVIACNEVRTRLGCAKAVEAMVEGLGVRAIGPADYKASSKTRYILGDKVLCRFDNDQEGVPERDLRPAAVVLIADYNKGAVTAKQMERIAAKYAGREIIADWHPARDRSFYHCATALKVSWDATPDHRPFIRTMGEHGMLLRVDGQEYHYPARTMTPLDPCGAGDMVLATLGAGRRLGLSWQECCEWATSTASLVCNKWGSVAINMPYSLWRAEANELPPRVA